MAKLSAVTIKRLNILIRHMEQRVNPMFTMLAVKHPCGTPACALGEAMTIPQFIADGIREQRGGFFGVKCSVFNPNADLIWKGLFSSNLYVTIKTPQDWAAHARAWLAANGANESESVGQRRLDKNTTDSQESPASERCLSDSDQPFRRFLGKVLEPVEVAS